MSVKLIGMTQPMRGITPDASSLLAYMARVSSTANQGNHETGPKLIKSLIKRKEWSPLEMVSLVMEINTTRDIARQILRHRSFSFQEFSQRYAKVTESFTLRPARLQDELDRQNSIPTDDPELQDWWEKRQFDLGFIIEDIYNLALKKGIAKEVARTILPEGMTMTKMYMSGTLRSWVHYIQLRADPKTQKEHRLIAEECKKIVIEQFPDIKEVFD